MTDAISWTDAGVSLTDAVSQILTVGVSQTDGNSGFLYFARLIEASVLSKFVEACLYSGEPLARHYSVKPIACFICHYDLVLNYLICISK